MVADSSRKDGSTRLLIIDDHPLVRHAIRQFLEHGPGAVNCMETNNAEEGFKGIEEFQPDVLLLDLELKGEDGLTLTKRIRTKYPKLPILVLSMHSESLYAERALRNGANGYVMKSEAPENIFKAIDEVLGGGIYASKETRQRILQNIRGDAAGHSDLHLERLSDRELQVFELIGHGYGTRQIAAELHLSVKTVETHRANIKKKMDLATAADLVNAAVLWMHHQGSLQHSTPKAV